jgi:hypothetical protein
LEKADRVTLIDHEPIEALLPRDKSGAQFVCYGDCCSGIPGADFERYFAAVNAVLARLRPPPSWISFVGDEVMGETKNYAALRAQWRYWDDHEMAWLDRSTCPIYHVPSNHTAYDEGSEAVWKEARPEVPSNGPPGQEGLSYFVRRGNLLIVCMDTSFSGLGGNGHVEHTWLDRVLAGNGDAQYKVVVGHYPAYAVNGYDEYPRWHIVPDQAEAFWKVLVQHGVFAYICSHVIAFDVQAHDGVLQITTGGAGTLAGPGGFMPGQTEYHHLVQVAVDQIGVRYQVLDTMGRRREWLRWPMSLPSAESWKPVLADSNAQSSLSISGQPQRSGQSRLILWRLTGQSVAQAEDDQTILCSSNDVTGPPPVWIDGPPTVWIGLEAGSLRVAVRLQVAPGAGVETWRGPALHPGEQFDFQVAVHAGMGPGGVMYRRTDDSEWSTMSSSSARGAELLVWPERWLLGHGRSGAQDLPFVGANLLASWYWEDLEPV